MREREDEKGHYKEKPWARVNMARRLKGKAKKETRLEKKARLARVAAGHEQAAAMAPYVVGGAVVAFVLLYIVLSRF